MARARRVGCRVFARCVSLPWLGASAGYLMMTSSFGQVFEGSINSQYRITGQVTGYCSYDLTFQKQS